MKKFTNSEKVAGELAVRRMSQKAREFYNGTDPLAVYEYDADNGKRYAYSGAIGEDEDLTFEELQEVFENLLGEEE